MTGLFLLALLIAWLVIVARLAIGVARNVRVAILQWSAGVLVFSILAPLPIADEIVGEREFNSLCQDGAVLKVDAQKIRGRKVKLAFEPSNQPLSGFAVPVTYTRVIFRDIASGDELGSYGRYVAKGGLLIRSLGLSESNSPLWMSRNHCSPGIGDVQISRQFGFDLIQ